MRAPGMAVKRDRITNGIRNPPCKQFVRMTLAISHHPPYCRSVVFIIWLISRRKPVQKERNLQMTRKWHVSWPEAVIGNNGTGTCAEIFTRLDHLDWNENTMAEEVGTRCGRRKQRNPKRKNGKTDIFLWNQYVWKYIIRFLSQSHGFMSISCACDVNFLCDVTLVICTWLYHIDPTTLVIIASWIINKCNLLSQFSLTIYIQYNNLRDKHNSAV